MATYPREWIQIDEDTMVLKPVPQPEPPPSLAPTSVQNMTLKDGIWESLPGWEKTIAALHFQLPRLGYGQKFKLSFSRRQKYPWIGTLNMKVLRVWNNEVGSYPNWYARRQTDGGTLLYTEKLSPVTGVSRFYFKYPPPSDTWRKEIWEWTANSALGVADGKIRIAIDGVTILDKNTWKTDDASNPGVPNLVCIEDDVSNSALPSDSRVSYKDIELTTW